MGVGDGLRCMTSIVQQLEGTGLDVTAVETRVGTDDLDGGLSLELDFFPDAVDSEDVSINVDDVSIGDDGTARFDVSVDITGKTAVDNPETTKTANGSNTKRQPVYKDPERLREVYESFDTFPAMTEALGVEVTPKTVRNHMVKHGIHDPEANKPDTETESNVAAEAERERESKTDMDDENEVRTSHESDDDSVVTDISNKENGSSPSDNGAEEGPLLSDGHGMPDDLTLDDIKRGVQSAATLTEFSYQLDIEHEQARVVLENLNLVDLVYGRVADGPNRDIPMEDIETRIRSAVGTTV